MKKNIFLLLIFIISFNLVLIQAINLDISNEPVLNTVVKELNNAAIFNLKITNLGESSNFQIYSLVGADIYPKDPIKIDSKETRVIAINVMPQQSMIAKKGSYALEYKIKNSKNEIQTDQLNINIVDLSEVFAMTPENINPKSEKITISVRNRINLNFEKIEMKLDSAFFEYETTLSLAPSETKKITIPLDQEKLKKLVAGPYLINVQIKTMEKSVKKDFIFNFLEQEDIQTTETQDGILRVRTEIIKKNLGNTRKTINIEIKRSLISYLFTTFNVVPTETKITGFQKHYIWQKELIPNEEIKIIVTTNWFYPVLILILIILAVYLIKKSIEIDLSLRKKVSFVKTKGGQFALKVVIHVKAKKYLERIRIVDKLPHLVELYEKFGAVAPDKVDLKNKRLEWNIDSLSQGEERIFTYIIYSKIGVVGRFELPNARAIYEKEGKIKEATSNRSFFINEPQRNV